MSLALHLLAAALVACPLTFFICMPVAAIGNILGNGFSMETYIGASYLAGFVMLALPAFSEKAREGI